MAHSENHSDRIEADDLIGKRLFNRDRYMGAGVVVGRKIASNLRGETRDVFLCVPAPGEEPVLRDVEPMVEDVNNPELGIDAYEIGELFDDVEPSDFDVEG